MTNKLPATTSFDLHERQKSQEIPVKLKKKWWCCGADVMVDPPQKKVVSFNSCVKDAHAVSNKRDAKMNTHKINPNSPYKERRIARIYTNLIESDLPKNYIPHPKQEEV